LLIQKGVDLLLFPDVIARCQHIDTGRKKFSSALDVDPHSAGSILRVRDGKVNLLFLDHSWDKLPHGPAGGATHHIA
jgi:hypothetical protein